MEIKETMVSMIITAGDWAPVNYENWGSTTLKIYKLPTWKPDLRTATLTSRPVRLITLYGARGPRDPASRRLYASANALVRDELTSMKVFVTVTSKGAWNKEQEIYRYYSIHEYYLKYNLPITLPKM